MNDITLDSPLATMVPAGPFLVAVPPAGPKVNSEWVPADDKVLASLETMRARIIDELETCRHHRHHHALRQDGAKSGDKKKAHAASRRRYETRIAENESKLKDIDQQIRTRRQVIHAVAVGGSTLRTTLRERKRQNMARDFDPNSTRMLVRIGGAIARKIGQGFSGLLGQGDLLARRVKLLLSRTGTRSQERRDNARLLAETGMSPSRDLVARMSNQAAMGMSDEAKNKRRRKRGMQMVHGGPV